MGRDHEGGGLTEVESRCLTALIEFLDTTGARSGAGLTQNEHRQVTGRGVREMSQHPAASGQFDRAVNPADGVGS